MSTNPPNEPLNLENLRERLLRLGLHGLLANLESIRHEPWLPQLLQIEETERARRSLRRRLKAARLQKYNPSGFGWYSRNHSRCDLCLTRLQPFPGSTRAARSAGPAA